MSPKLRTEVTYVTTGFVTDLPDTQRALEGIGYRVTRSTRPAERLVAPGPVIVDGTQDARGAKRYCLELARYRVASPVLAVIGVATLSDVSAQWRVSDFIVEGSSSAEIDARLTRAVARRDAITDAAQRRMGDLVLDEGAMTLSDGTVDVPLSHVEYELLKVFFDNPDLVLSRRALLARAWPDHSSASTRNIDTMICRTRRKLGLRGHQIETIRGIGYRFTTERADELVSA
jgi:DNA-binding response OmpR family regulator